MTCVSNREKVGFGDRVQYSTVPVGSEGFRCIQATLVNCKNSNAVPILLTMVCVVMERDNYS